MATKPNRRRPTHQPHVRATDDESKMRVVRDIPLWGILSVVGAILSAFGASFVTMYYGQQSLADKMEAMTRETREVKLELRSTNNEIQKNNIGAATMQLQINGLENRYARLEERMPPPAPRLK